MFIDEQPTEIIGGYGGVFSPNRAEEVVTLFKLAAEHNLPFDIIDLYYGLINTVYRGEKFDANTKTDTE